MSGMRKKRKERARAEQAADLESPELLEAVDGEVVAEDAEEGEPVDGESEESKVERVTRIVEALLFASDKPLTLQRLKELTHQRTTKRIEAGLVVLKEDYEGRGIVLHEVAGGWQFRTAPECSEWVQQLVVGRPVRLSRAQLETLAIIAYRQPITRPEIDDIRGVDSSGTLHVLLDRNLVRVLGKKEEPGRPFAVRHHKGSSSSSTCRSCATAHAARVSMSCPRESMLEVERLTAETDAAGRNPRTTTTSRRPPDGRDAPATVPVAGRESPPAAGAEDLITAGRVRVNGVVVSVLGSKVDPATDHVQVVGQPVQQEELFYVLLNKPKGCLTTLHDPAGRPTVMDYLPNLPVKVVPVGRLDFNTEGVLFLTNDGELSAALQAAKTHAEKTYHVKVRGTVAEGAIERLRRGVKLDDGYRTGPARVDHLRQQGSHDWLVITIVEGKTADPPHARRGRQHGGQDPAGRVRRADLPRPAGPTPASDHAEVARLRDLAKLGSEPVDRPRPLGPAASRATALAGPRAGPRRARPGRSGAQAPPPPRRRNDDGRGWRAKRRDPRTCWFWYSARVGFAPTRSSTACSRSDRLLRAVAPASCRWRTRPRCSSRSRPGWPSTS